MKYLLLFTLLGFIIFTQIGCKQESSRYWPTGEIKSEEEKYRASMFPILNADPIFNEGLTLGKVIRSDKARLSSAQINQLLNIRVWQIPLSVPGETISVSIYLEEYDGEQKVRTLAYRNFRTETKKGASEHVSDIITIALRFSDLQRSGTAAFWTSEYCWFSTDAAKWHSDGFSSPSVVKNPFYQITKSGITYGYKSYVDPSLFPENEPEKYTAERERLAEIRRTDFQVALLSVSGGEFPKNKGPNIRVSFRIDERRKLPKK
ncbi:MAG: hypothetical protein L3J39_12445 [Verrucomicrobiales bacterium]|nr:hypothetical protein [Verrucomicrobiales bacterium]